VYQLLCEQIEWIHFQPLLHDALFELLLDLLEVAVFLQVRHITRVEDAIEVLQHDLVDDLRVLEEEH